MSVMEPDLDVVGELLADPACPVLRVMRDPGRVVPVLSFIAFARSRGYATGPVEALTDAYVHAHGGRRDRIIAPWTWMPNVIRRLTGGLPSVPQDIWMLREFDDG